MPAISSCKKTSNTYQFSRYDDNDKSGRAKEVISGKTVNLLMILVAPSGDSTNETVVIGNK